MTTRLLAPLFYSVCLLSGIAIFAHSFTGKYAGILSSGSMIYPRVILCGWIFFATISLVQSLLKPQPVQGGKGKQVILAMASILFLCLAMVPLGFIPTGLLFFCLFSFALGFTNITITLLSSAGTTLALWYLFEKILAMPLPGGLFF